jgi:hypothetical protein
MEPSGNLKQRILVTGLIVLGLAIVLFFGLRTERAFRQFRGHHPPPPFTTQSLETDVSLIRDWMTLPFISKMYRVPPPILFEALAIPEAGNRGKSLEQLNKEYYPEAAGTVLQKIQAAILTYQSQQPYPPSGTPARP